MKRSLALIAPLLASIAYPSASIAQDPRPVTLGVAFQTQKSWVKVAEVRRGGIGDRIGLRPGDVITHAGGRLINSQAKLTTYIRGLNAGGRVELTVRRKGKQVLLTGTAMAPQ